jgi:hypothetical protein
MLSSIERMVRKEENNLIIASKFSKVSDYSVYTPYIKFAQVSHIPVTYNRMHNYKEPADC